MENDLISRQAAISHVGDVPYIKEHPNVGLLWKAWIESLPSAQPVAKDINVPINDCISRQAAIDAMGRATWAINRINELPSAQPEKHTEERTETHACDCISRQEVIDTVRKIILGFFSEKDGVMTDTDKTLLSVNKAICNGVRALTSAQPVDEAYLIDWYISSVDDSDPVWTEAHIEELMNDFYLIPKGCIDG